MSLFVCEKCGNMVSTQASRCPKCLSDISEMQQNTVPILSNTFADHERGYYEYLKDQRLRENYHIEENGCLDKVSKFSKVMSIPSFVQWIKPGRISSQYAYDEYGDEGSAGLFENNDVVEEIYLPETITKIPCRTFNRCKNLKIVHLPKTVETIEDWAFGNCKSLKSIELPDGLQGIGNDAFYGCTSLESIRIPSSLYHLSAEVFANCISLKQLAIEDGKEFGFYDLNGEFSPHTSGKCFSGCLSLADIRIGNRPNFLNELSDGSCDWFTDCPNIRNIDFPKSCQMRFKIETAGPVFYFDIREMQGDVLTRYSSYCAGVWELPSAICEIAPDALKGYPVKAKVILLHAGFRKFAVDTFMWFTELSEYQVDEDSPYYCAISGVLFSKDRSTLISYPCKKEGSAFSIPSYVTRIAPYAFQRNLLTTLFIPDSVVTICEGNFCTSDTKIREIRFPPHYSNV